MELHKIIYVCIYVCLLILYTYTETCGVLKYRAVNKILLSSMFLSFFMFSFFGKYNLDALHVPVFLGFLFAWVGDITLLFNFMGGACLFFASNIFFILYNFMLVGSLGVRLTQMWWSFLIPVIIIAFMIALKTKGIIQFGKFGWSLPLYLSSVTLHGSMGLAIVTYGRETNYVLFGLGLVLFMLSDYFLVVHKLYHKKNWVLRCNSVLYFLGMMMAALSFSY